MADKNLPPKLAGLSDRRLKKKVQQSEGVLDLDSETASLIDCPETGEVCKLCPRQDDPGNERGRPVCTGPVTGMGGPPLEGCQYRPGRFTVNESGGTGGTLPEPRDSGFKHDDQSITADSGLDVVDDLEKEILRDEPQHQDDEIRLAEDENIPEPYGKLIDSGLDLLDTVQGERRPDNFSEMSDSQKIDHVMDQGGMLKHEDGRYIISCQCHNNAICGLFPVDGGKHVCTGPNPGWFNKEYLFGLIQGESFTGRRQPFDHCPFNPDNRLD